MKVINDTKWDTRDLRRLLLLVAKRELDPHQIPNLVVHFSERTSAVEGRGTLGASSREPAATSWIYLDAPSTLASNPLCVNCGKDRRTHEGLPPNPARLPEVEALSEALLRFVRGPSWTAHAFSAPRGTMLPGAQVAFVIAHELQHNKGRRHRDFARRYRDFDFAEWSWAPAIRQKPKWRSEESGARNPAVPAKSGA